MSKEAKELQDEFRVFRLSEKVLPSDIARLLQQLSTARMFRRAARVTAQRNPESRDMTTIGFKRLYFVLLQQDPRWSVFRRPFSSALWRNS